MVIIFSGIPGSGKTTIAKLLANKLRSKLGRKTTTKLFISDALSPPVYKKFFRLLHDNLGKYDFLIFDGTFYRRAWRDKMKKIARGEKTILVYVYASIPTAVKRNRKRRPHILERVVHIMARRFEPPKNADIVLDTEKLTPTQAAQKILRSL